MHDVLTLSRTGADPGHQSIPSSWPKDLDGLNTQIYTYVHVPLSEYLKLTRQPRSYTQNVVQSFANQGTPIDILQVGKKLATLRGTMRRKRDGTVLATAEHNKFNIDPDPKL